MYQPYEDSNVFKRLRQIILEKNIFSYFFLYFARVQNLKKTRARGAKQKYELDRPNSQNTTHSSIAKEVQYYREGTESETT